MTGAPRDPEPPAANSARASAPAPAPAPASAPVSAAATATVAVHVRAPLELVFDRFVREIDQWWRRGPKFRHAGRHAGRIEVEARLGGRIRETWTEDGVAREFELGRVLVWEPPERFVWSWRNATFAPLEQTEVEVTFVKQNAGTLVTVRHRGWERLRPDHPARHGLLGRAFVRDLGLWWGDLLGALREFLPRP
jgi:uncharacterized protein YndB with AHSA1/START domain